MRRPITAIVFVAAMLAAGCSSKLSFYAKADKALATALTATNAARDSFVAWDESHQTALVKSSATAEEAQVKVDTYRQKRDTVQRAFVVAYSAIAAAATAIAIVKKQGEGLNVEQLLIDAVTAAVDVKRAVDAIRDSEKSSIETPPDAAPAKPEPTPAPEAPPPATSTSTTPPDNGP